MSNPYLAAAQIGMNVLAAGASAKNQASMSKGAMEATVANLAATDAELLREQVDVNRQADENKTDRQRQYDQEIGAIRVAAAEGMGSAARFAQQSGYLLGVDLSRIETNRKGQVYSLQSKKEAARADAQNFNNQERNKVRVARENVLFSAVGSGVQIGADYYKQKSMMDALKNTRTPSQ